MRPLAFAFALLLSALAFSQASEAASDIDEAFGDRMTQQSDKWFEDGEFPVIIQMLKVKQELQPLDEETATDLGWMYKNIERPDLELLTYIQYAKRNPSDRDHLYPVANFYYLAKSYVSVVEVLKGIDKQVPPPHPNAFRILAHAYTRLGLYTDALRIWDAYIKLAPEDPQAKNNRQKVADIMAGKVKSGKADPPGQEAVGGPPARRRTETGGGAT